MKTNMKTTRVVMAILAATLTTGVYARGGVAPAAGLFTVPTLPTPAFTPAQAASLHGFDMTGFLQNATASSCGGTATINGITITIPCNMIIQMPANTFTWNEMIAAGPSMTMAGGTYIPYELNVVGNIVNGQYIAGLMYISQQSLNGATGVIQAIDYATGNLRVNTGGVTPVTVQINDPNGRFGRPQSPDIRLSVDDENPTIHAATGYPMCVPRAINPTTGVANPVISGIPQDALCPQKNRPRATATTPCRLFGQTGIALPASGELTVTPAGNFCSQFVMKALVGSTNDTTGTRLLASYIATASDPDAKSQAPLEVGDTISFSGTLMASGIISAHTIEANVGIYTQPKTQPSYLAIGEFGVGTADPTLLAANGAAQETQDRIFLETATTDVYTPVDIYMVDVDPATGVEHNRWVSMFSMTGECDPALALSPQCMGSQGGVATQYYQAQPQRARVRLAKATPGILSAPSRTMRVMARSLCRPGTDLDSATGHSTTLDNCFASHQTLVANGLVAGQYSAPVFEYIFPENTKPGDPIVPNDLWHLPFLVNGDADVGPLNPRPW
jgi:hypothetical protein